MLHSAARGQRLIAPIVVLAAAVLLGAVPGSGAPADPEGGTPQLRAALEAATRGHVAAKHRLVQARAQQARLTVQRDRARVDAGQVAAVASKAYRFGRLSRLTVLLNSGSTADFLDGFSRLDVLARSEARTLSGYRQALARVETAKQGIDRAVEQQRAQVAVLAKRKQQAERALAAVGGGASRGFTDVSAPLAGSAPRAADGSWPREACAVPDPTTSGCITPRLHHAYRQARAAGFTRYASCFSERSSGEHPRGRACDFAAARGGFADAHARGGDRAYGDDLAAYLVHNADRLGVLYVIWYRQIWLPGTGWRSYSGGGGPAGAHTNHVHLSVL